jgi:hypothetical protein
MAKSYVAPALLGAGVVFLLLRGRGSGSSSCPDALKGVWYEPEGGNLPITHAFYEDVESFMKEALATESGIEREVAVRMAKKALLPGCEFSEMTAMHEDVHGAIGEVYDNVKDDL